MATAPGLVFERLRWRRKKGQEQAALEEVKLLSGLLSICASCKRILNERKVWEPLESYIQAHSEAKFTHGVCPDCLRKLYPEQFGAWEQDLQAALKVKTQVDAGLRIPGRKLAWLGEAGDA
jgi:hypothetical protein